MVNRPAPQAREGKARGNAGSAVYRFNREGLMKITLFASLLLEANNIKLDRPYTVNDIGVGIAFVTDPWGTYIEINERPPQ
jgi:hypothetical protein